MRPGLLLVCDPHMPRAQRAVRQMVHALAGGEAAPHLLAVSGPGFAAAVIAPPVTGERACGAAAVEHEGDLLLWSGDLIDLPAGIEAAAFAAGDARSEPGPIIGRWMLDQFRTRGIEAAADWDGAFCGAWFDHHRHRWLVFNDHCGQLPVFWSANDERLVVAPRASLAWLGGDGPLEPDSRGVCDLLRCENMVADHTLIEGVHWLEPAHTFAWSRDGCGTFRRAPLSAPGTDAGVSDVQAIQGLHETLIAGLSRHALARHPLLLGISGGIDSRTMLAVCGEIGRLPATFTAGWSIADDVRFGRRAARAAGARHEHVPLPAAGLVDRLRRAIEATDGLHSVAHMAPGAVMRDHLRTQSDHVLIEGYLFGGIVGQYVPADAEVAGGVPAHASAWARRYLHAGGDIHDISALLRPDLALSSHREWQARVDDCWHDVPSDDPLVKAERVIVEGRSGRIDVLGTAMLREDVLVRCPATDIAMRRWLEQTPPQLRRGKRLCLELLRTKYPRLACVPRCGCGGLPIAAGRVQREWCWQRERLHRLTQAVLRPWTRRHGTGGQAVRAWTLQQWHASGALELLFEREARVRAFTQSPQLERLRSRAAADLAAAGPLLSLITIEHGLRHLEALNAARSREPAPWLQFRRLSGSSVSDNDNVLRTADAAESKMLTSLTR